MVSVMCKADLIQRLSDAIGADRILSDDQLGALDPVMARENTHALLALAPRSTADIAAIFDICNASHTPLIAQGGRTGLAGAATATGVEILCLVTGLPHEIEIDAISQTVRVSANTTLADLEAAARGYGLSAGIDIAARDSATIGGMISTNAGGMEAFRNGTMRERVLGLEAVLPDGTVLRDLAQVRKCNEGYDIKQLLIGSEGTLGVITTAMLQLLPAPPQPRTFLFALPGAAAALEVMRALQSSPFISLLRAEAMWNQFAVQNARLQVTNPLLGLPDAPLYVIYDVHCSDGDANENSNGEDIVFKTLESHFAAGQILDAFAAQSGQQAVDIWALREDTLSMGRMFPHCEWFDISIPLASLDDMVKTIETRIHALNRGLRIHVLGHLGDGNLHYSIVHESPISQDLKASIKSAVMDSLKDIGGSFSAEHGIGTEKRAALQTYGDPGKLMLMRAIKRTFDPNNICNPGKVL